MTMNAVQPERELDSLDHLEERITRAVELVNQLRAENESLQEQLTAAVAERMSWKYPHPVAYRMLLQNIGHMAQVFSMTATALGFGASLTGAVRGTEADTMLRLRQPGEFTTFALACGLPVRRPDGLPKSIQLPADAPEYY